MVDNCLATLIVLAHFVYVAIIVNPAIGQTGNEKPAQIVNGDFAEWKDGQPVGWVVAPGIFIGADKPLSEISKVDGPAIELSGDSKTLAWNLVSQSVALKPGEMYRLTFDARTAELKREGNQYDNCHIGFWFKDGAGKTVGNEIAHIDSEKFKPYAISFRVPDVAKAADLSLTLSKSGKLRVKGIKLASLSGVGSFDFLVDEMRSKYSYFKLKNVNVDKLADRYREKADAAKTVDEFLEVVADMLAELKDVHTWVIKDGKPYGKFKSSFKPNYNFDVVDAQLKDAKTVGNDAVVGRTVDGIGYVRITSLGSQATNDLPKIQKAVAGLFDAPAMIIDIRRNNGGSEPIAKEIAGMFANREYVYAKHRVRNSDGKWGVVQERKLQPVGKKIYEMPTICLTGPGAVSSAEAFAMMFKSLKHGITAGLPTRGASGNPAAVTLPNGVEVWFSRWVAMELDGTPIEDRGVIPDVAVKPDPKNRKDPTFQRAVRILKKKLAKK